MAGTWNAVGGIVVPTEAVFTPGRYIQRGGATPLALAAVLKNDNTLWADWGPTTLMGQTNQAAANCYTTSDGAAFGALPPILAWRGHWGREARNTMLFQFCTATSDGATAGQIQIGSAAGAATTTIAIPASAGAWQRVSGAVAWSTAAIDAGVDTLYAKIRRSAGAGTVSLKAYSARWQQYQAANLPTTVQVSGACQHDDAEGAVDSATHVQLWRDAYDTVLSFRNGVHFYCPVYGHSQILDSGSKAGWMFTGAADWTQTGPIVLYPRQYQVEQVRFWVFGQYGGASGQIQIRNLDYPGDVPTAVNLIASATPPDSLNSAHWGSATVPVRRLWTDMDPIRCGTVGPPSYFDRLQIELISDGAADAWIESLVIQEEAR